MIEEKLFSKATFLLRGLFRGRSSSVHRNLFSLVILLGVFWGASRPANAVISTTDCANVGSGAFCSNANTCTGSDIPTSGSCPYCCAGVGNVIDTSGGSITGFSEATCDALSSSNSAQNGCKTTSPGSSYTNKGSCQGSLGYCYILNTSNTNNTNTNSSSTGWTAGLNRVNSLGLSTKSIGEVIKNLIVVLLTLIGLISIIAFIIAGFKYLTAGGDEKQATEAKQMVKYASIGIVVALSGVIILQTITILLKAGF